MIVTALDKINPAWLAAPRRTLRRAMQPSKALIRPSDEDDPAKVKFLEELRAKRAAIELID